MSVIARTLVLFVAGLLFAVAFVQASSRAPQVARTRAALASQARARAALTDRLQRQADTLRDRYAADRSRELADTAAGSAVDARVRDLEVAAALYPLRGPGLLVTVGDSTRQADPLTGNRGAGDVANPGQIRDRDLAQLVNALWAAGAEGISVDGQRLSPTSTIRAAGGAILVDFRPVSSPYEIRAVGNAGHMQARFLDSSIARSFSTFTQLYGIQFSVRRSDSVTVPGAPAPELRYAEPDAGAR